MKVGASVPKIFKRVRHSRFNKPLTPEPKAPGRGPQDAMDSYVWKTDIPEFEKFIFPDAKN